MNLQNEIDRELALLDPAHYAHWITRGRYQKTRLAQAIADAIVETVYGDCRRLIVCAPPGHGKSTLISVHGISWILDREPQRLIGLGAYGDEFSETWGRRVRDQIVENPDRTRVRIKQGANSKVGDWRTTAGGGMVTFGYMGGIMGRRLHGLVVDDPIKNSSEAYSPTKQATLREVYESTIATRLEPGAFVIVTMQRWPGRDFIQWLIDGSDEGREKWNALLLPILYDEEAARHGPDPMGRKIGEALWPEKWPAEWAQQKRLSLEDQAFWHAQWQQRPLQETEKGLAYLNFSPKHSVEETAFNPKQPILWGLDFNVDPMCSVIAQADREFKSAQFDWLHAVHHDEQEKKTIRVLDELYLENSSTQEACRAFIAKCVPWFPRNGNLEVIVYGDASGHSRKTTSPADYRVVEEMLRADGRFTFSIRAAKANPSQRERVVTVNNAFLNAAGERRLFVHPKCAELRKDLGFMRWRRDAAGNVTGDLDDSNSRRGHISDALGYLAYSELKMQSRGGWKQDRIA